MNIRDYISPKEMLMFVDSVIDMCSQTGEFEPAIYDYAFRINTMIFFTDKELPEDQEELTKIAYSDECNNIISENTNRRYMIMGLDRACKDKIRMNQNKLLYIYNSAALSSPFNKISDSVSEFFDILKDTFDQEKIIETVLKAKKEEEKENKNEELLHSQAIGE